MYTKKQNTQEKGEIKTTVLTTADSIFWAENGMAAPPYPDVTRAKRKIRSLLNIIPKHCLPLVLTLLY